ncbi:MAG: hypothetical protein RLY87_2256 [Chloroflexota bacterium]
MQSVALTRTALHSPHLQIDIWFADGALHYASTPKSVGMPIARGTLAHITVDGTPVVWQRAIVAATSADRATIELHTPLLKATVHIESYADQPFVRTSAIVTSTATHTQRISACRLLHIELAQAPLYLFHVDQFSWSYRTDYFSSHQSQIWPGRTPIEIRMGSYPSHYNGASSCAWFALRPPPHDTDETQPASGPGIVCGIEFNGKSRIHAAATATTTTIQSSIDTLCHDLAPGALFDIPAVFFGHYDGDWDEAGYVTQRYAEAHVHPAYPDDRYPWVQYNSWKYGQEINEAQQLAVIDRCHDLGIEVVVLDLGWANTIGDWRPNPTKFPNGLAPIAARAASYGMRFGVHIAIAQCAADAPIASQHPEWLASTYDDYYQAGTLCFGNDPCRAWIIEQVSNLIEQHGINYIIQDGEDMVKVCHRDDHTHTPGNSNYANSQTGIDVVIGTLRAKYPHVVFENCEDGGMMMTYKMARLYHTSITVDNIGAYATRQGIYGASYPFSPRYSVRYFEDDPTPYTLRSSIFGGPLIFMQRITEWNATEYADAKAAIMEYKAYRELIRSAKIIHLLAPKYNINRIGFGWDAIQAVSPTQHESVVFYYRAQGESPERVLYIRGLNPSGNYTLTDRDRGTLGSHSGATLMRDGVPVRLEENSAGIIHLIQNA